MREYRTQTEIFLSKFAASFHESTVGRDRRNGIWVLLTVLVWKAARHVQGVAASSDGKKSGIELPFYVKERNSFAELK